MISVALALVVSVHAAPDKLNICFFLAADLRADCISVLGSKIVKPPNIDKLCADGFAFRNVYTLGSNVGAVCVPSRVMGQLLK